MSDEPRAARPPTTPPRWRACRRPGASACSRTGPGLFTSDLSVNEFLLVKEAGFEPLGLVVGSSIYHIGIQMAGWKKSQEMTVLSEAMYGARQLAMTRMEEEADQLGADGVVGVRLDIGRYEWGQDMAEFIAIGTAVKHRDGVLHRAPNGRPFTSDLSGQDFWTLLRTGHRPVGMVMGSCVYHVAHRGMLQSMAQTGRNVELANFTQALYDARELAMERMQTEAQEIARGGDRRRPAAGEEPRLGQPHDRVLRDRHGDRPARGPARGDRGADHRARPQLSAARADASAHPPGPAPARRARPVAALAAAQARAPPAAGLP